MGATQSLTRQPAVTGDRALDSILRLLERQTSKKAARAGLSAALTVVVQAVRKEVNATGGVSADLRREARRSIGKRIRTRKGVVTGKVGFGVGKRKSKVASATKARSKRQAKGKSQGGVGISAQNVHWAVLGTGDRRTKAGKATGRMSPLLKGVVPRAAQTASKQAVRRFKEKAEEAILRDVLRNYKRKR